VTAPWTELHPKTGWLAYCRPGFEAECATELIELGGPGPLETGDGWCWLGIETALPDLAELIFARQLIATYAEVALPPRDRLTALFNAFVELATPLAEVWIETADTNEGRKLSGFVPAVLPTLRESLQDAKLLSPPARGRKRYAKVATAVGHAFVVNPTTAWIGLRDIRSGSPWPMGIPRLRLPPGAPSRSAAKIAEAFHTLLGDQRTEALIIPGRRAVDLGAAPGGWSWWLAEKGIRVVAVDNGPLAPSALATGMIDHIRADGFRYRPPGRVDWVVCDMVEQPRRIARLMGDWLIDGAARHALFNLKLPMKKRLEEVRGCCDELAKRLESNGVDHEWGVKQLYHDREEVTVAIVRVG
jgi:23S rRNA (cytidine2498-2'-O)-methyltransferase